MKWGLFKKRNKIKAVQIPVPFEIYPNTVRREIGEKGDYLVCNNGTYTILSKKYFEQNYKESSF